MIQEIWLHLQAFLDILFTRNVLTEVAALGVCISLGWLAAVLLRDRQPPRRAPPVAFWSGDILAVRRVRRTPGGGRAGFRAPVPRHSRRSALRRDHPGRRGTSGRRVRRDPYRRTIVCDQPRQQVVAAKHRESADFGDLARVRRRLPGWLDPIIAGLDSIGIASGKSRVTVWSVLKLLFTLTLFVLVAAWISRWLDRRLKKLSSLAPSTRIGLAKSANAFLIGSASWSA